ENQTLRVLMVTEGTYPFYWGGVSTWCHLLLGDMSEIDFSLLSIVGDPGAKTRFDLPPNVRDFIVVPIWRVREALEARRDMPLMNLIRRKLRTSEAVVTRAFLPS
ncbi:MAG: glycosyltransferase, partial [Phototrophicales bacterium]